jgi:hypothetical protein
MSKCRFALIFGSLSVLLVLALAVVRIGNQFGLGARRLEILLAWTLVLSLAGNLLGLVLGVKGVREQGQVNRAGIGLALNGLVLAGGSLFLICYLLYGL